MKLLRLVFLTAILVVITSLLNMVEQAKAAQPPGQGGGLAIKLVTAKEITPGNAYGDGTYSIDTGFNLDSIILIASQNGTQVAQGNCNPNPKLMTWSGTITGLPPGTYQVFAKISESSGAQKATMTSNSKDVIITK